MSDTNLMLFDDKGRPVPLTLVGGPGAGAGVVDPMDSALKLDVRAIWSAIYRNRLLIIVILGLAIGSALIVTMLTTPIYEAQASIQIEQQTTRVMNSDNDVTPDGMQDADRFLQTQLDILRSRSLAERVAQSLNLAGDNRFLLAMGRRVAPGTGPALGSALAQRSAVIGLLKSNLGVVLPRDSRVATVTFDSPDPVVAARVVNSFADNFIVANLQRKYDASAYARNFLQQQLAEAKQRLEEAERASIAYARSAGLIDASAGASGTATDNGPRSLVTSSLIQFNASLSAAIANRISAEKRWQQAQRTPIMSLPEVQGNGSIQALVRQRAELDASYKQQLTRRKADFPEMKQAAAQIEELNAQIATLSGFARNAIRDQYEIARQQENALRSDLGNLKRETLTEQDRSVRLNILRREVDTSRTLYDGLLQRYKEVGASAGIAANNISIVDRAEPPGSPILPRPMLNLALGVLGGLALSMVLVFARETFDDAIRSADDIDRKLSTPFLGSVPLLPVGDTPTDALGNARSAFSEAHYALRSSLEFATSTGLPRTLLLTSSQQAEGKSTTSLALARSFARIGRRVLLIDGDLRKPSLQRMLNLPSQPGFSNVLTRQCSVEQAVQVTDVPNLSFIPSGPLPPNPAELLASSSVREMLNDLVTRYDLILIDGPPVMGLADAPLLSALVEGVVFVIEANRAHRGQAKIALRRLREAHAVILGSVLTKFDARSTGYGADYGYSYSYGTPEKIKGKRGVSLIFGPKRTEPDEAPADEVV